MSIVAVRQYLLISLISLNPGCAVRFSVWSMVDEGADRNLRHQLWHSPGVVRVIVSKQHIVDATNTSSLGRSNNTIRIASFITWPTRINQQGMLRGSYEQRCLPSFCIDEINLKGRM